jgi:hypothetical protein
MKTSLISKIASTIEARQNCKKLNNTEWFENHTFYLEELEKKYLPHGSGIDSGCNINLELSKPDKIVIHFGYHFMNENGYYERWEYYNLVVTPSFHGIDLRIVGKDKNGIKDYLYQVFDYCLTEEIEFNPIKK